MEDAKHVKSRIVVLRELKGFSQKDFADKIGITQGALSQIESGKSNASFDTIKKISDEFDVNCNWLIKGIGQISLENEEESRGFDVKKLIQPVDMTGRVLIPLVREEAQAGYMNGFGDPEYIKTLDVYQIPGFESGNYRLFEIEGDSMQPAVHPREIVICEFVKDWKSIENGSLCVVITQEGILAKRLYYYDENKNMLLLKSDNAKYKTFSIETKSVYEIWYMRAKITSVFADNNLGEKRLEKLESDINLLKNQVKKLKNK